MSIVTFRASRRASLVVKAPGSSAPSIDEFLASAASHPALLDSEVFYPLDTEGPGVYKCRGWEASVLWLKVLPVLTVRIMPDPNSPRTLNMDVVGTDFTGLGEETINDSTELTSSNVVRWRTFEDSLGNDMLQITSKANVEVLLALPNWFPVAPTILEAAGSQAVQVVLDNSLPRFLQRVMDAYSWWAGIGGASSASRAWRRPGLSGTQWTGPVADRTLTGGSTSEPTTSQAVVSADFEPAVVYPEEPVPAEPDSSAFVPQPAMETRIAEPVAEMPAAPVAEPAVQPVAEPEVLRTAVTQSPQAGSTEAAAPDPIEKRSSMWAKFYANKDRMFVFESTRTLVLPLREPVDSATGACSFPVDEYLTDPERLVRIVYGDPQFTRVGKDRWVIKLIAINILKWSVVPVYELVMSYENGRLLSQGASVALDPENRPEVFDDMELLMRLNTVTDVVRDQSRIKQEDATCQLEAKAELAIAADLPGVLKMVPGLKQIGDGVLDAILAAVEFAARAFLEKDYLKYVEADKEQRAAAAAAAVVSPTVDTVAATEEPVATHQPEQ